MGGHGALTIALKQPAGSWASVSAFAPISNPTQCPWGQKAFTNYLGSVEAGKGHDATVLMEQGDVMRYDDILIDVGTDDQFVKEGQLLVENLEEAAAKAGQSISVRQQKGFGHSYFTSTSMNLFGSCCVMYCCAYHVLLPISSTFQWRHSSKTTLTFT